MHQRFLSWLIVLMIGSVVLLRAQAPAQMPPGLVLVARVTGTANMTLDGQTTLLRQDDQIPQLATVTTGTGSSVVLVFSNGATTQLGEDSELVIQEFLQDPFAATIQVAALEQEPSPSRTRLKLNKGELVGNVKRLRHDQGSSFVVETPVGAAGIRGTTFRIVFRPTGTGLAFFSLSTVEGNVAFGAGDSGTGAGPGPGGAPGGPPGGDLGVSVGGGQEVVVTVEVNVDPVTNTVTVVGTPTVTSTLVVPIDANVQAQVVQTAQTMAVATAEAIFTSPPPGGGPGGGGGGGPSGTTSGDQGNQGSQGNQGNQGNQGGQNFAGNNDDNSNNPPTGNTPPLPVPSPPRVTTGDGQPAA